MTEKQEVDYENYDEVNDLIDKLCDTESTCKSDVADILLGFDSRDIYQMREITFSDLELMEKIKVCNSLSNEQIGECVQKFRGRYRGDWVEQGRIFREAILLGRIQDESLSRILNNAIELGYIN